ncbi:hypothetical protein SAMN05216317_10490 [Nitrosomonas eutropha]|uniref:Transposase n=1 Tax=Nitrosomonas eutropha TaxID=916 RepID=A0ABX5MCM4_9PROT|nr:hypothetical protein C8R14_10495 [Nitrosomonas eutropha]SCX00300.1 hypothetical protein SAMN05216379_10198 [Nitrosomonas eutropha]SDW32348.1 hypothetical protein SAMN05216317_10490 [Nitrosomonas eutropha]SEI57434.1 hypothetical protein SAMN05216318_10612 [Nitrosomonas eutropha]
MIEQPGLVNPYTSPGKNVNNHLIESIINDYFLVIKIH